MIILICINIVYDHIVNLLEEKKSPQRNFASSPSNTVADPEVVLGVRVPCPPFLNIQRK